MKPDQLKAAAFAAIEQGDLAAARPLWLQLCELVPLEVDHWLILAAIDESLGFFPAALGHLKYAFHLDADDSDIWLKSAQIKWEMRDFNGALSDLAMALSLDFTDTEVRQLFALWLVRLHRFDLAFGQYQYLLKAEDASDDLLLDALSCAYCRKRVFDLESHCIKDRVVLDAKRLQFLASGVIDRVLLWLTPESWPQWHDAPAMGGARCELIFQAVSERLGQERGNFNWPRYNDYIAHTEEQTLSKPERDAVVGLANIVDRFLATNTDEIVHVFEFGCGTGLLGQLIKAKNTNILLTGVDYSDVALKVINGKNNYDTLIHREVLPDINADRLLGVTCVVVESRVSHYESQTGLLEQLLKVVDQQATVIVIFAATGADPVDQKVFTAQFPDDAKRFEWHVLSESDHEKRVLLIQGRTTANEPQPLQPVDRLEQGGNALIAATTYLKQAQFDECRLACQTVLELKPLASQALFSLGLIAQDAGEHTKAISYYRQARLRYRGFADNWFQIATVHQHRGNIQAMFNAYHQCLSFAPTHVAALQNLVGLHFSQGNMEAAWHHLRLLLLQHALDESILERVENTVKQSQDDTLQKHYQDLMQGVEWIKARFNAAIQSKYFDRAGKYLDEIEALCPEQEAEFLRAQLEEKSGRLQRAKQRLLALHEQNENNEMYLQGIASISAEQGLIPESYQAWVSALKTTAIANQNLQNFLFFANYCNFLSDEAVSEHHLSWGRRLSESLSEKRSNRRTVMQPAEADNRRIRIAYISADFRMHSVSMFLYNVLKYHDTEKFSVVCYSMTPAEDPMTIKLRYFVDCWRNINFMSDEALAERIRLDKIDILVDLAGHTAGNRLPVFAHRPAPIQCTYLGYPNTTGLPEIDYRLTDNEADPKGMTEHLHSEQLIRLPNGFLSYSRHLTSTPVTLYEQQDEARHYTFACCNNIFKVNERVVEVFSRILKQMPEASLLLKAHNLNNPEVIDHYQRLFKSQGVAEHQVHLMNTIDVDEHQNLYNSIDIALDPFPYNGTTTSCDALWMGVPVLVLAGTRHAGRVGVSLLTRIGMTDWIAQSEKEYVSKAIEFARDRENLSKIKLGMRSRLLASPLMRPRCVVRDIEQAYLGMIQGPSV